MEGWAVAAGVWAAEGMTSVVEISEGENRRAALGVVTASRAALSEIWKLIGETREGQRTRGQNGKT